MNNKNVIQLGDTAKDSVTGFQGTVVSITEWLHACKRVQIQPNELKDGKPLDTYVFDMPQCVLVSKANDHQPEETKTGGPAIAPVRNADPV